MLYAKVVNDSVIKSPYLIRDLKVDYPDTSFPADFLSRPEARDYNIVRVVEPEIPHKPGWRAVSAGLQKSGSDWVQAWTLVPKEISELEEPDIEEVDPPVQEGYLAELGEPELVGDVWKQKWNLVEGTWLQNRVLAYGPVEEQIEFITENGLSAWQTQVAEIKARYPKT
jgi:hypothetical protein|tara:strand:+ start:770 stop:1276 length:507 start_codon:yes stop_codon:yes gene_type:complete